MLYGPWRKLVKTRSFLGILRTAPSSKPVGTVAIMRRLERSAGPTGHHQQRSYERLALIGEWLGQSVTPPTHVVSHGHCCNNVVRREDNQERGEL